MSEITTTVTEQLQQLQMLMHRAMFHDFTGDGKTHSPHRGQGRVLAILKMKPEISQKELTYLLGMSKQSLAELLTKLEKSGYITREPSEEDRRVVVVKRTEKGLKAAEDVDDRPSESAKILDCLNDEELAAFSDYLSRVIKRYEEQFPGEDYEERRKSMEEFILRHRHGHGHGRGHGHGHGNGFDGHGDKRRGHFSDKRHGNTKDCQDCQLKDCQNCQRGG